MDYSVLRKADKTKVSIEPFPHLIINDALPKRVYNELCDSFPSRLISDNLFESDNKRLDIYSSWGNSLLQEREVPIEWRDFLEQHSNSIFMEHFFSVFGSSCEKFKKSLLSPIIDRNYKRIHLFPKKAVDYREIKVRVTIGVNTPTSGVSQVRGPHVDNKMKAFVGLFYLRDIADTSDGGELLLYRWKEGNYRNYKWAAGFNAHEVEIVKKIPYEANKLVMFLNTDNAIHGVSVRGATDFCRRLVVISGWLPDHTADEKTKRLLGI
jgi:hypothetical protein